MYERVCAHVKAWLKKNQILCNNNTTTITVRIMQVTTDLYLQLCFDQKLTKFLYFLSENKTKQVRFLDK